MLHILLFCLYCNVNFKFFSSLAWSEMAPIKTPSKRTGESIDADDVATPKKEKKTPAKKTPKVVQLGAGIPKSPSGLKSPMASPVSTPVLSKKTPLKPKTPSAVTPANTDTPKGIYTYLLFLVQVLY